MMKSCLKVTPPISPILSGAASPSGPGRASPGTGQHGAGVRKTVSFCEEDELEEVFVADEWDRTPAPATPKLSYQDILELKQLRISLPYSPPPPTYRQPFTTSAPSSYSSSCSPASSSNTASPSPPPFPYSRFATGPSYTPARWKNRQEQSPSQIDPEILPYLEAVPIRLLPLLDQRSPTPSPPPMSKSSPPPNSIKSNLPSPPPEPSSRSSPSKQISAPNEPTAPPLSSSTTMRRAPNFAFLPLLPAQEPSPAAAPARTQMAQPAPKRKFNMTFLPVLGTDNSSTPTPTAPTPPTARSNTVLPLPLSLARPELFPPTPAVSSGASDTDTDTDAATDTDTESDAPSTVESSLPSPPCDDDDAHDDALLADSYFSPLHSPTQKHASLSLALAPALKKLTLGALPSPALAPPSPFSLYPPSPQVTPPEGTPRARARRALRSETDLTVESMRAAWERGHEERLVPSISRRRVE